VAFATTATEWVRDADVDRPLHEAACAAVGVDIDHRNWSDPDVAWDDYDLVVVRSTWDYLDHLDDYRAWLARVGALGILHNPAPVIDWNLDKRYLLDLSAAGVPVVATAVCASADDVAAALAACRGEVVVKPVVSAGSQRTGRFAAGDPAAAALAHEILGRGTGVLVQPAVASVVRDGEVSALVFGGVISHAARKGPILALGGGLVGGSYTERLVAEELTPERRAVVEAASRAVGELVAERFGIAEPLLYARFDLVTLDDGTEAVLEAELAEPAFFFPTAPDAADRFARVLDRRLGPGPG